MKLIFQFGLKTIVSIISIGSLYLPIISLADSAPPNFDSNTEILNLPLVSVDKDQYFENIRLKLDFTTGRFELLSGASEDTPRNEGYSQYKFARCTDNIPKQVCDPLIEDSNASQFVSDSNCSRLFPQVEYLPTQEYEQYCSTLDLNCGVCLIVQE